jgi:phenylalanyl-tRNA synthetase beta subunit
MYSVLSSILIFYAKLKDLKRSLPEPLKFPKIIRDFAFVFDKEVANMKK